MSSSARMRRITTLTVAGQLSRDYGTFYLDEKTDVLEMIREVLERACPLDKNRKADYVDRWYGGFVKISVEVDGG